MDAFSAIDEIFLGCDTPQEKYKKIIELGRALPPFPEEKKVSNNIVKGCQSTVYLAATVENGKIFFYAESDALISAGLAALLLKAYNGHEPEYLLKAPPTFLEKHSIGSSLSFGRSNGLASMFLQMQRLSLKFLSSSTVQM